MASIDACNNSSQRDKLLESIRALCPLLSSASNSHDVLHGYLKSSPLAASPPTISTEDLDILDSPTILSSLEQDMLLSSLGGGPSPAHMDIDCDEWNFPSDGNFTAWKHHEIQGQDVPPAQQHPPEPIPSDDTGKTATTPKPDAVKSWLSWSMEKDSTKVIKAACSSPSLLANKTSSSLSPKRHRFKRPTSATDILKQLESSDNSDAADDDDDGDNRSPNGKAPMSKNLVSERRRRKKLNERLYSLRAIVPKISKMDKASIVGDAINYVQDLQKQVEDMQSDILTLQSSKDGSVEGLPDSGTDRVASMQSPPTKLPEHKILELDVSKMEEETYHLRIHCKKAPGVLVQLTRALDALDFEIVNANLTSVSDHILNTIVMKVKNGEMLESEELREMVLEVVPKFGLSL